MHISASLFQNLLTSQNPQTLLATHFNGKSLKVEHGTHFDCLYL